MEMSFSSVHGYDWLQKLQIDSVLVSYGNTSSVKEKLRELTNSSAVQRKKNLLCVDQCVSFKENS